MDNLQRIYERFEDINDFAGYKPEKAYYGWEYLQKFDELGVDDNLMDLINAFQSDSTGAAYLDGVRFGMRFKLYPLSRTNLVIFNRECLFSFAFYYSI